MALSNLFGGFDWSGGRPVAQQNTGRAPSYNMNDGTGQNFLGMGMSAMGAGRIDNGVYAFLDPSTGELDPQFARKVSQLQQARGNGPITDNGTFTSQYEGTADRRAMFGQLDPTGINGQLPKMQNELKDYWRVKGASAGWDGQQDMRGLATTTYKNDGGIWNPISAPQYEHNREKGGWLAENPEFMEAVSVMLPAVGGWAGLANMAAPSVTGAMAGAIGNGATNALINAAGSTLMSGGNWQSGLSSLIGSGVSSGVSSAMSGQGLSNIFGNNTATLGGGMPSGGYSSLGQYLGSGSGQALRSSAPMRGEMGQLFGAGRTLSSLFGRFL